MRTRGKKAWFSLGGISATGKPDEAPGSVGRIRMTLFARGKPPLAPAARAALEALGVAAVGFALLHVAFLGVALIALALQRLFPPAEGPRLFLLSGTALVVFLVLALAGLWPALRSRLPRWLKAGYVTMPTATALAGIGIALYRWPLAVFLVSGALVVALLAWLVATKKPWLYAYAVALVALVLGLFAALGGEI